MGVLRVNKNKSGLNVEGEVSIFQYEEEGIFYCMSPELDIVGYDRSQEDAFMSFKTQLEAFFEYLINKDCLDQELKRLGWKNSGKPEFIAPKSEDLVGKNELFTELLNKQNYSKSATPVAYS